MVNSQHSTASNPTSVCVAEMPCFSLQPQNAAWSHIKKLFLHWSNTTFKCRICSLFWCLSWWKTSAVKMIVWRCCWFNKVNLILCSWVEPLGANAPLKRMCFCFWNDSSDPPLRPGQSVGAHTGGFLPSGRFAKTFTHFRSRRRASKKVHQQQSTSQFHNHIRGRGIFIYSFTTNQLALNK